MALRRLKKISLIIASTALIMTGCIEEPEKIELNVSAAASLKESMLEIEKKYEQENPEIDLILNFGGSGSLKQQITQGAPCDIFISASTRYMDVLKAEGYLMDNKYSQLAKNQLVLASKTNNIKSLKDLQDKSIKNIAIGEINSVPAGQYANEVLINEEIKDDIESKLVYAKDVKEVLAWIESENVQAGFVYYTDIINNDKLNIYKIDENLHSPIMYPIGIVNNTKKGYEAKLFEEYLLKEKTQEIFQKYGYIK